MDAARKERGAGRRIGELRKELKRREKCSLSNRVIAHFVQVLYFEQISVGIEAVLRSSKVIGSTLTSASPDGALKALQQVEGLGVDVVVIDEVGQALEASAWQALLQGRRAVVAGDDFQLPPTILSPGGSAAMSGAKSDVAGACRAGREG